MAVLPDGGTPSRDIAWLVDDLADRLADFRRAVILSRDGLCIAASRELFREEAEHLSAGAGAAAPGAAAAGVVLRVPAGVTGVPADDNWPQRESGPVVRPYAVTGGRTE